MPPRAKNNVLHAMPQKNWSFKEEPKMTETPKEIWKSIYPHHRGGFYPAYHHKPVCTDPNSVVKYIPESHARSPEFLATLTSEQMEAAGFVRVECRGCVGDCQICKNLK
jgi:hypothetical protein